MGRDQIVKEKQKARTGNGFGLFLWIKIKDQRLDFSC